ncbi:glycosyltransferase [Marinicella gelatinilytica]|uniref:glycosyltransferase n=1 Tax=Marinicella gelatinilytica TaxID=2996017 RepID=UPI002260BD59|nr:glycosyltransferase [Marinicella gelatinilytica]MCX7544338.1 glycosyltransferase [Marinicella gelatinilytica]
MTNDILTVHDLFFIKGGGERLIMTLCQQLRSDLLTAAVSIDSFSLDDLPGELFNLNALGTLPGIKTWQLARAFKKTPPTVHHYNNVIYSGVAAPLANRHFEKAQNIFYCHTPPRFIYDKKQHYLNGLSAWQKPALKALIRWFQPQYEAAINNMDAIIANSKHIQQRIKTHLNQDSHVVYPPCDTHYFNWQSQGDYYLSVGRHDPLKRIDVIIEAFKSLPNKKLVVASGGSETHKLKKSAAGHSNIYFTGWLEEPKLLDLLGNCLATIYIPEDEDFGMTPVESMAAGKPVIASHQGGIKETVIDQETGLFIGGDQLKNKLIQIVKSLSANKAAAMREACEARAEDFNQQQFIDGIKKYLK